MAGLFQPTTPDGVAAAAEKHGPAPGAKTLLEAEREAAEYAISTGLYTVFRSTSSKHPDFCTRVAPTAKCFCGHALQEHSELKLRSCGSCKCKAFRYIPFRPEEVGEFWLPRRKGFNVHTWRAKCRCKCGSDCHEPIPPYRCKSCSCGGFQSDFLCVVCDLHWEEHETVTESEQERQMQGFPVGQDFVPFNDSPQLFNAVFKPRAKANPLQPKHSAKPERSVRLMPVNCGGRGEGKPARVFLEGETKSALVPQQRRFTSVTDAGSRGQGSKGEGWLRGRGGMDGVGVMEGLAGPPVDTCAATAGRQRMGGREGGLRAQARAGHERRDGGGGVGSRKGGREEGEERAGLGSGGGEWGASRGGVGGWGAGMHVGSRARGTGGGGRGGAEAGARAAGKQTDVGGGLGGEGGGGLQGIYGSLFGGEREAASHASGEAMLQRLRAASGRR